MGLRDLIFGVSKARRPAPGVNAFLDDLARSPQMHAADQARRIAADDVFFGRPVDPFAGVEADIPMSRQLADADVGTFGNPAVQRMLEEAEMFGNARDLQSGDVVDMLARNDRMNTLARVNAQRLGGERAELFGIAQDNIDRARLARQRAASAAENNEMIADAALGAGLGLGSMYAAGLLDREMDDAMRSPPPVVAAEAATDVWPEETMIMDEDDSVYLEPSTPEDIADMIPPVGGEVYQPPDDMRRMASMLYPQIYDKSLEGLSDANAAARDMANLIPPYPPEFDGTDFDSAEQRRQREYTDGFYLGKPNLPGLSDRQQEQADVLVRHGVSPAEASDALRGYRPLTDDQMRILMKYGRGEMSW